MDWTPLAQTALGGLLTAGGGFFAQWASQRRAAEHQRQSWVRGLRHEAHLAFLKVFDEKYTAAAAASDSGSSEEAPEDWLVPVYDQLQVVRLLSAPETVRAATEALEALQAMVFRSGQWQMVEYQLDRYRGAVRAEYELDEIPLMGD